MSFDGLVAAGVVSRHRASADLDDPHASKQGFDTEKQGDGTEVTEKDSMALRAVLDRALREAPGSFSSVS